MKIKIKFIASIAVAMLTMCGLFSISAYAEYVYSTVNHDDIPSVTADYYDLPAYNYTGNDIGASRIHVTAPPNTNVAYYLSLYRHGWFWNERLSDIDYPCQTAGLDGACYWDSINTNGGTTNAYISLTRYDRNNKVTLGGYIESRTRTWK